MELNSASKIALIGGGKMGEAIMGGLLSSSDPFAQQVSASSFTVANPGQERRDYLTQTYGVECVPDGAMIPAADVVILAVKPQVMPRVLQSFRDLEAYGANGAPSPLFISIAAGLTTATIAGLLAPGARVVRVMPNTPLMVSSGMTAVVGDGGASAEDIEFTRQLFACLGSAVVVSEAEMDAVCAVSGSGPAYVALFVEALRDAGVREGLSFDLAEQLALQTVLGTARLIAQTGQEPAAVRKAVCSPGGTTLAGLDAMTAAGFIPSIESAVAAAKKRSIELGAS